MAIPYSTHDSRPPMRRGPYVPIRLRMYGFSVTASAITKKKKKRTEGKGTKGKGREGRRERKGRDSSHSVMPKTHMNRKRSTRQ